MTSLSPSPLAEDYRTITEGCGLLDRSDRGKLALSGSQAKAFLQGQVTNDVEALSEGQGCYAAFLTPKGKMLGDLRIIDAGEELLLDTERVALQPLFNMIRGFSIGYELELHKRTLERGLLSLIGPQATATAEAQELGAQEHANAALELDGMPVRAIRTDVGIDLLCRSADTDAIAAYLLARGAGAVGEDVAECLRVEQGRPRYGVDLDDTVIPQEAGLNDRAVSFTKGCYVGQETVARLHYRGKPNRHLRGVRCDAPVSRDSELSFEGRVVGTLTSVATSPRFGPIALGLVRRAATPGSIVSVNAEGIDATVVDLPFR